MKMRVRGDLVFVRPQPKPTTSLGGIAMVHDNPHRTDRGTVVAIGDGPVSANGVLLPHLVAIGDDVLFSPDSGEQLLFERETIVAMRETDILAIIEG